MAPITDGSTLHAQITTNALERLEITQCLEGQEWNDTDRLKALVNIVLDITRQPNTYRQRIILFPPEPAGNDNYPVPEFSYYYRLGDQSWHITVKRQRDMVRLAAIAKDAANGDVDEFHIESWPALTVEAKFHDTRLFIVDNVLYVDERELCAKPVN